MSHWTPAQALAQLHAEGSEFSALFRHGSLEVEFYKPNKVDRQQPHTRDELYVIATGHGQFIVQGRECRVGPGDVLFVPAGAEHRFYGFSEDFGTWVFFYGPQGGESA
ncbi:cupin domain-containing protein [Thiomonas sp. FB-6]|uniref:cupin domain-containing protein n=1 Tax=Thiomonas sp. FB-6 TaxID=1158291 RepID=UPI00037DEF74|nr:cupin domain-containing protein [Thiomonas sp. FB-6]